MALDLGDAILLGAELNAEMEHQSARLQNLWVRAAPGWLTPWERPSQMNEGAGAAGSAGAAIMGRVTGLVIGVGGFLGAGEKDVIVPFAAVKPTKKNDKWWLTLDESKDNLKNAPGFKYDKASTTWVPDKK